MLGISSEAVKKRWQYALMEMRKWFSNRGFTIGAMGLALGMAADQSAAAESPPLALDKFIRPTPGSDAERWSQSEWLTWTGIAGVLMSVVTVALVISMSDPHQEPVGATVSDAPVQFPSTASGVWVVTEVTIKTSEPGAIDGRTGRFVRDPAGVPAPGPAAERRLVVHDDGAWMESRSAGPSLLMAHGAGPSGSWLYDRATDVAVIGRPPSPASAVRVNPDHVRSEWAAQFTRHQQLPDGQDGIRRWSFTQPTGSQSLLREVQIEMDPVTGLLRTERLLGVDGSERLRSYERRDEQQTAITDHRGVLASTTVVLPDPRGAFIAAPVGVLASALVEANARLDLVRDAGLNIPFDPFNPGASPAVPVLAGYESLTCSRLQSAIPADVVLRTTQTVVALWPREGSAVAAWDAAATANLPSEWSRLLPDFICAEHTSFRESPASPVQRRIGPPMHVADAVALLLKAGFSLSAVPEVQGIRVEMALRHPLPARDVLCVLAAQARLLVSIQDGRVHLQPWPGTKLH